MKASSLSVTPVSPAAGYIGGKRNLARRIIPLIDGCGCEAYAEPFVGMGGIFLRRRRILQREFINDISGDVVTFFRVLQEHYAYFIDMLRWRIASRAEFDRLRALPPERLTDLQRAARFLYLQRLVFGGKVAGRSFGVDRAQGARFNVTKIEPLLAEIHERLAHVTIEQLGYADFIARYDRADVLFYLDPPYWDCEDDYGAGVFDRADFARLADVLSRISGRFLMSINDTPGVRQCFATFDQAPIETTYSISTASGGAKRAGELLISNFALPPI